MRYRLVWVFPDDGSGINPSLTFSLQLEIAEMLRDLVLFCYDYIPKRTCFSKFTLKSAFLSGTCPFGLSDRRNCTGDRTMIRASFTRRDEARRIHRNGRRKSTRCPERREKTSLKRSSRRSYPSTIERRAKRRSAARWIVTWRVGVVLL